MRLGENEAKWKTLGPRTSSTEVRNKQRRKKSIITGAGGNQDRMASRKASRKRFQEAWPSTSCSADTSSKSRTENNQEPSQETGKCSFGRLVGVKKGARR
jgi:hypothetical protein